MQTFNEWTKTDVVNHRSDLSNDDLGLAWNAAISSAQEVLRVNTPPGTDQDIAWVRMERLKVKFNPHGEMI